MKRSDADARRRKQLLLALVPPRLAGVARAGGLFEHSLVYKNASGSLILQVTGAALSFALHLYFARALGVEGYGLYVLALSSTSLAVLLARLGFDKAAVRFLAEYTAAGDRALARSFSSTAFLMVVAGGAVVTAAYVAGALLFASEQELERVFVAAGLTIAPVALLHLAQAQMRGLGRVILAVAPEALVQPLAFGVAVVVLNAGGDLTPARVLLAYGATAAATAVWLYLRVRSLVRLEPRRERPVKQWLATSGGLILVGGANVLWAEADALLLGLLAGAREVGLYAIPLRLTAALGLVPSAVALVVAPILAASAARGDQEGAQRLVTSVTRTSTACVVLAAGLLLMLAPVLLGALGSGFRSGYVALWILVLGQVVYVLCGPAEVLLSVTGHQLALSRLLLVAACVNALLCLVLIPFLGAAGAALGSATSRCIETYLAKRVVLQRLGLDTGLRLRTDPRAAAPPAR